MFPPKELLLLSQFPSQKQSLKLLTSVLFRVKFTLAHVAEGITENVFSHFHVHEWARDKLHFKECEPFLCGLLYKNTWVDCWLGHWLTYSVVYLLEAPGEDTGLS